MATRTVVCPDCSEPLTLGRLSCSSCGALLASVTGAPRRTRPLRTVVVDEPTWLSDEDTLAWLDDAASHDEDDLAPAVSRAAAAPVPAFVVEQGSTPSDGPGRDPDAVLAGPESSGRRSEAGAEPDLEPRAGGGSTAEALAAVADPVPEVESGTDEHRGEPPGETQLSWVDLRVAAVTSPEAVAESADAASAPSAQAPDAASVETAEPDPASSPVEPDVPAAEPVPTLPDSQPGDLSPDETVGAPGDVDDASEPPPPEVVPQSVGRRALAPQDDGPARPLQPSHVTRSRLDLGARPAAESAAPTWEPDGVVLDPMPAAPAGAWVPPTVEPDGVAVAAAQPAADAAAGRSDFKLDLPDDLPTGLTVVGSGIATLGFLLPWAAAAPGAGWLDRWGLAESSYSVVFLAAAVLLGLNIIPTRLAGWIRAGVLPLGLGGLLLGLVWPAMLGGSGMQLGAVAVTFAAFLLVAGGVVGVSRARQRPPQPAF